MAKHETLERVEIELDYNEDGLLRWLVTPVMRHHGRLVSVPDTKGWAERMAAEIEKARIIEQSN